DVKERWEPVGPLLRQLLEVLDRGVVLLRGVEDAGQLQLGQLLEGVDVLVAVVVWPLLADDEDLLERVDRGRALVLAHVGDALEELRLDVERVLALDRLEEGDRLVEVALAIEVAAEQVIELVPD